jgi:anti-anti-sigma factor
MVASSPFPATRSPLTQAAIVVDLIGDLDATAVQAFAMTAARLSERPSERIVVNLRHAALLDAGGVTVLASTIAELRRRGLEVDVVAQSRRVRTALRAARIAARAGSPADATARDRHVMIVRNAFPARDCA